MRAVLADSDDCVKIIGLDGSLLFMSEGGKRAMEVDDFDAIKGCPWPTFWQGQGNLDAVAAIEAARTGQKSSFTGSATTAKGNLRHWHVKVSPILGSDGNVASILSVSRDITAARQAEEQQELLRNELSHRIKNLLALVQAVANQTLHDDDDMAVAKPAFLARLGALARAQDLLFQKAVQSASLQTVAETIASQYLGRIIVKGPHVVLSARSALAIALALHELATNAAKYGALSSPRGIVDLSWRIEQSKGDATLNLTWTESLGPLVSEPTTKGFGSRLIERALASYIGGASAISYLTTGVVFRLHAPLDRLARD